MRLWLGDPVELAVAVADAVTVADADWVIEGVTAALRVSVADGVSD